MPLSTQELELWRPGVAWLSRPCVTFGTRLAVRHFVLAETVAFGQATIEIYGHADFDSGPRWSFEYRGETPQDVVAHAVRAHWPSGTSRHRKRSWVNTIVSRLVPDGIAAPSRVRHVVTETGLTARWFARGRT